MKCGSPSTRCDHRCRGVRRTPRDAYHRSDRRVRPCRPPRQHQAPRVARRGPRCGVCTGTVTTGSRYCVNCVSTVNRENLLEQAKLGRIAIHSPSAEARRSATQRKQFDAIRKRNPSELPDWLNEKAYRREILPRLSKVTVKAICLALECHLILSEDRDLPPWPVSVGDRRRSEIAAF